MRVVYEKPLFEKIDDAIREAKKVNKKIEYILLSKDEAVVLFDSYGGFLDIVYSYVEKTKLIHNSHYCGIRVKVESLM